MGVIIVPYSIVERGLAMRIVYVLTTLSVGGTEKQVVALSRRMTARGHDVALVALRSQTPSDVEADCAVMHLDMRRTVATTLAGFARGLRFLRRFKPDLVHSHNVHGNLFARLMGIAYRGAPVISTIHNVYEGGWLRMLAYRLTDRLSSANVAVSEAAAERYVRIGAVPRRKCVVITNGIDSEEFTPDRERRDLTREQMGVVEGFVWLTAGRIVPAKDYANLLSAFAKLREAENAVQLWIAGDGMASYAAGMQSLAAQLDLRGAVRWLGMRRDMPGLFDAADGFVLGSAWEGMPVALGEAMAMEKPVVATDVGGVRELIGDAAMIVAAKDPGALGEAMLAVMRKSSKVRQEHGQAARERIMAAFNVGAKADEWEELYLSLKKNGIKT